MKKIEIKKMEEAFSQMSELTDNFRTFNSTKKALALTLFEELKSSEEITDVIQKKINSIVRYAITKKGKLKLQFNKEYKEPSIDYLKLSAKNETELRVLMNNLKDLFLKMETREEAQVFLVCVCGIRNVNLQMTGFEVYRSWGIEFEPMAMSFNVGEKMKELSNAQTTVTNKIDEYIKDIKNKT